MFVMAVTMSMLENKGISMDNIKVDKILKGIRFEIDSVRCAYNIEPNKIIIGCELLYLLVSYNFTLQYKNVNKYILYGIPVMIDYDNPWNVEVCICFKVDEDYEGICDR